MIFGDGKYSKKQWSIFIVYGLIYFLFTSLMSFQPPFYPMVAETKGVTPTQIGIVFGTYNFAILFFSFFVAEMISKFGITSLSLTGVFVTGITDILFGFIERINDFKLFLGLSIAMRILESLGITLNRSVAISRVSFEFFENAEVAFGFVQMFSSLGSLLGPVIGGALFEVRGFALPFAIFGILLLLTAIPVIFLHKHYPKEEAKSTENILKLIPLPQVIFGAFSLIVAYTNDGFIRTTLEQHLKDLILSPVEVGLIFSCKELALGSSVLFWSKLYEKYESAGIICLISSILNICGLILIGPAPYIPLQKNIYSLLFGLIFNSIGIGGGKIGGYSFFNRGARIAGLPKTLQTYGLISSMYSFSLAFGRLIGSLLGGFLFETFEFGWGSHFFILFHVTLCGGAFIYYYFSKDKSNMQENLRRVILQSSNNETQTYRSTE